MWTLHPFTRRLKQVRSTARMDNPHRRPGVERPPPPPLDTPTTSAFCCFYSFTSTFQSRDSLIKPGVGRGLRLSPKSPLSTRSSHSAVGVPLATRSHCLVDYQQGAVLVREPTRESFSPRVPAQKTFSDRVRCFDFSSVCPTNMVLLTGVYCHGRGEWFIISFSIVKKFATHLHLTSEFK